MISKRTKALDIKPSVRKVVHERDNDACILCQPDWDENNLRYQK